MHALSEFGSSNQYSLSSALHLAGFPNDIAIAAGSVQYAAFAAFGVFLAWSLSRRMPGSIVFAPLACAVTGGTFIHQTEIAGALPFAFAVAASLPTASAWLGVGLIAIPLEYLLDYGGTLIAGLVVSLILVYRRCFGWVGAVALGLIVSVTFAVAHKLWPPTLGHATPPIVPGDAFSDVPWTVMQNNITPENAFWWPTHVLVYVGLAAMYWNAVGILRSRPR